MRKLFCLFIFPSLILISCSSGDSSSTTADAVLINKIAETNVSDGSTYSTTYVYSGKKMLRSNFSTGYYQTYTYTGDLLTQIKMYNGANTLKGTQTFTYNPANKLLSYLRIDFGADSGFREDFVYNSDGTVSIASYSGDTLSQTAPSNTYVMHFSEGEVSSIETFDGINLISTNTFTHDIKNSPFKNVTGYDKIAILASESTGITHNLLTDDYQNFGTPHHISHTYTYNSLNFPLTDLEVEDGDTSSATNTVYTYN